MRVPKIPIEMVRRTNRPAIVWQMESAPGTPFPVEDGVYELVVGWAKGQLKRDNNPGGDGGLEIDVAKGWVIWPYTYEDSLTVGTPGAAYELFRTYQGERNMVCGGPVEIERFL